MLEKFGAGILRAKGIVEFAGDGGPSVFQYVGGGDVKIEAAGFDGDAPQPMGIVVIAMSISEAALIDIFESHGLGPALITHAAAGHHHQGPI